MFRDSFIAAIRTGVASLVGFLVAFLLSQGVDLPEEFAINFTMAVTVLLTALYNWAVILLERKVNPMFGILLGIPKAPVYGSVGTATPETPQPSAVDAALDYVSPSVHGTELPPEA